MSKKIQLLEQVQGNTRVVRYNFTQSNFKPTEYFSDTF